MSPTPPPEAALLALRQAHAAHAAGDIDGALAAARCAIETAPEWHEPWVYLGTTLTTRKLAYQAGLEALERALELAPDDPGVHYSLGWCYEFVAYRLEREPATPFADPYDLYLLAVDHLQRCIELDPEEGLKEDADDLLQSVLDRL